MPVSGMAEIEVYVCLTEKPAILVTPQGGNVYALGLRCFEGDERKGGQELECCGVGPLFFSLFKKETIFQWLYSPKY